MAENGLLPSEHKDKLKRLLELKNEKTKLDSDRKAIVAEQAELYEQMFKVFTDEEIPKITLEIEGKNRTFFRKQEAFPKVDDFEEMKGWLLENNKEYMIKETVNAQTLRSFCNERRDDNLPLPDGVSTFDKNTIGIK